jgi:hypothetical protein
MVKRSSGKNFVIKKTALNQPPKPAKADKFIEGVDYYYEDGLMVLTAHFLLKRGYCCDSGCRHCPYGEQPKNES